MMIRNVFLVFSFILSGLLSHAQAEKGNLLLGGGLLFSSNEFATSFSVTPEIGFFVTDNLALGSLVSISHYKAKSGFFNIEVTNTAIGPFIKYYFTQNNKGKPFVKLNPLILLGDGDGETQLSFSVGYAVFLNESVALDIAPSLILAEGEALVQFGVGFQIHFMPKSKVE